MATLDLPDELYERLRARARQQNRSLPDEVAALLEHAPEGADLSAAGALEQIRKNRYHYPEGVEVPDSTTLLREDRER